MLKRSAVSLVCLIALVLFAAACGDDDSDDGGTASASEGDSGVAEAEAFVEKFSKTPTSINLDTPLDGEPVSGKKVVQLKCAVPECQEIYDGLAESAEVVGWETQDVNMGATPEEVTQAFQQALDLNPDAIVISGIPLAVWKTYADQAKQQGIPIVNISSTGNGLVATLNGSAVTSGLGEMTGNFIVADSGGDANVALFTVPDYPTLKPWVDSTTGVIADLCPDCNTEVINAEAGDIGTKLPQTIVSTIQQDPDIDYVALAFGGMSTGVRAALNEAGFNDVSIVGEGSVAANLQALRDGTEQMWAAQVTKMQGWYATDVLLRFYNDQDLGVEQNDLVYPTQILTPENVPESGDQYLEPADYQEQFQQLWGVG
jgi:ribose transport system substrate-binding protein